MDDFLALIIGVGGEDIPETVTDSKAILDILTTKGAYNPKNTFFLTEDKSTKANIIKAFNAIIKKSKEKKDSTVFIYYSGHGQKFPQATGDEFDYYLITHGADRNKKEKTMLNGDIFSKKIEKIKSNRVLVMLDCCYAGGMKTQGLKIKGEEKVKYSNIALQEKLKSGKGRVFVSSCDDNETSVILPNAKNSLFTEVALEVLDGLFSQDREYVSVLDLIFNVLNEVPKRIEPFKHQQNPILTEANNLSHKYYICKNGKSKQGGSTIEDNLERLEITKVEENLKVDKIDDLDKEDKIEVDKFIKKMNLDSAVQPEFKKDLINKVGGIRNLKSVNTKMQPIKLQRPKAIQCLEVKSILNTVNEEVDTQTKLDFIKNYKYKI